MTFPDLSKMKLFQKSATAIFLFFMGLMCFVTLKAFSRTSGSTGLDMGKVQQLRYEAQKAKEIAHAKELTDKQAISNNIEK